MRLRLIACVALAMMVAGASVWSSRRALAQEGGSGQGQQSEQERSGDHPADIDKALKAYDERMDRNLDKCRQELDQMKKELHELIDLRLGMAISLAELRTRNPMPGMGFQAREGGGQGSPGHGEGHAAMARELQTIYNQLRSDVEQQRNQVDQLAAQLRGMKGQGRQASPGGESGPGRRPQPVQGPQGRAQEQGKGQGPQGRAQEQGKGQGPQGRAQEQDKG